MNTFEPTANPDRDLAERSSQALTELTVAMDAGERRPQQMEMIKVVAEALHDDEDAIVTAGTGTGKSLGYLIPAILSEQRVVVATATKALQDQLANKDLPLLQERLPKPFTYTVLKGRSNYLCMQRLREAEAKGPTLDSAFDGADSETVVKVRAFADSTRSGDVAESSLDDSTIRDFTVTSDECPGTGDCPSGNVCFAGRAKQKAEESDLVVVNQHLYATSLNGLDTIPEHTTVVIDEAHKFMDIVTDMIGMKIRPSALTKAANAAKTFITAEQYERLRECGRDLRDVLGEHLGNRLSASLPRNVVESLRASELQINALMEAMRGFDNDHAVAKRAAKYAKRIRGDINALLGLSEDNGVIWVEGRTHAPVLCWTRLDVSSVLRSNLWATHCGILTSATMPQNPQAHFGLPAETVDVDVGSPFDYKAQGLLYLPTCDSLNPKIVNARAAQHSEMSELIESAGGRALVLFTSRTALNEGYAALNEEFPQIQMLHQDHGHKPDLIARFQEDESSCLFATMGFWEGIDVPGPACSLVIIDKVPFPVPSDPIHEARSEQAGPRAFIRVALPHASLLLAQGVGRLIRTHNDTGVVAILDSRIATNHYGKRLLDALPPMRVTHELDDACGFLSRLVSA